MRTCTLNTYWSYTLTFFSFSLSLPLVILSTGKDGPFWQKGNSCCSAPLRVRLVLTADSIFVFQFESTLESVDTALLRVRLCDVIGTQSSTKQLSQATQAHTLHIYEYAPRQSGCLSSGERKRKVFEFQFEQSATCTLWGESISAQLRLPVSGIVDSPAASTGTGTSSSDSAGDLQENPITSPNVHAAAPAPAPVLPDDSDSGSWSKDAPAKVVRRKFLVFVNPHSGTGHALKVYNGHIKRMFEEANVDVELFITQRANHAFEHVQSEAFNPTLYDVICIVSGDGLIFEVVNGIASRPQGDGMELLAKVPLAPIPGGTGNGLAKSILFASDEPYSAVNSAFVAIKGTPSPLDLSSVQTTKEKHVSFLSLGWGLISDIDILSEGMRCLGEMRLYLAAVYFIASKRKYRGKLSMVLTTETGDKNDSISTSADTRNYKDVEANSNNTTEIFQDPANAKFRKVIEGEFLLVWAVQTSHAAATMHSGPGVTLDDGVFTVYVVRSMSRCELLQLLVEVDTGDHVKRAAVEVYKAHSYCLEPDMAQKGIYSLDGEVVEYGPITGKVLPQAARVLRISS